MNASSKPQTEQGGDIVALGDFTINIGQIDKSDLLKMRLMLPVQGYKLLKNSKNARLCRQRNKDKQNDKHSELAKVQSENKRLRAIVAKTEKKLLEA